MDPHYRAALRQARDRRNASLIEPRRILASHKSAAGKRRQAARRTYDATLAQVERELVAAINVFRAAHAKAEAVEAEDIRLAHRIVRIVDVKRRRSAVERVAG